MPSLLLSSASAVDYVLYTCEIRLIFSRKVSVHLLHRIRIRFLIWLLRSVCVCKAVPVITHTDGHKMKRNCQLRKVLFVVVFVHFGFSSFHRIVLCTFDSFANKQLMFLSHARNKHNKSRRSRSQSRKIIIGNFCVYFDLLGFCLFFFKCISFICTNCVSVTAPLNVCECGEAWSCLNVAKFRSLCRK